MINQEYKLAKTMTDIFPLITETNTQSVLWHRCVEYEDKTIGVLTNTSMSCKDFLMDTYTKPQYSYLVASQRNRKLDPDKEWIAIGLSIDADKTVEYFKNFLTYEEKLGICGQTEYFLETNQAFFSNPFNYKGINTILMIKPAKFWYSNWNVLSIYLGLLRIYLGGYDYKTGLQANSNLREETYLSQSRPTDRAFIRAVFKNPKILMKCKDDAKFGMHGSLRNQQDHGSTGIFYWGSNYNIEALNLYYPATTSRFTAARNLWKTNQEKMKKCRDAKLAIKNSKKMS